MSLKKWFFLSVACISTTLIMSGCSSSLFSNSATTEGTPVGETGIPAPQQLTTQDGYLRDIPVPRDYKGVDAETFLFETKNGMVLARRLFKGNIAAESVSQIYRREMPRHGWVIDSVSITGNKVTHLYSKPNSMALITIQGNAFGSEVNIQYSAYKPTGASSAAPAARPVAGSGYVDDTLFPR
ncbi:hypothetical protein [Chrysiogenes arsenatis]|uniref:hypothetical protein n=1 Tax=Chrysiogenes arsenatis TaxID=309797 RepID=UPI000423260B|nr:hypothetical protein [Chrysiogenes arsenatis]